MAASLAIGASPAGPMPRVLFGLGATKAGTSWLYRYLESHPDVFVRSIKELHFFNTQAGDRFFLRQLRKRKQAVSKRLRGLSPSDPNYAPSAQIFADLEHYIPVLENGETDAYLAYLTHGMNGQSLVADVTPAYALLNQERLSEIVSSVPEAHFVYLMRDPVSRLWSHVRMQAKRKVLRDGGDLHQICANIFDAVLAGEETAISTRGDYVSALGKFDAVIPTDRLDLRFYEELFTDTAIKGLCDFAGLSEHAANFDKEVHKGASVPMTAEQNARAAKALRPQYDAVRARMGRLPEKWEAIYAEGDR